MSEFRNLVERQNVDFVIGYISSGDCLAVAPVAEEMKKVTVLFDCGTPRVFEERSYKYVFRTRPHATMDAVAATLYLLEQRPDVKTYAGINQNYAWGQDSWNDFELAMKTRQPDAQVTTSQMPKFGAGQYGAEISALAQSGSDVIHSSLWGGDLEAFMMQAVPRDLFKQEPARAGGGRALPASAGQHHSRRHHRRRARHAWRVRARQHAQHLAARTIYKTKAGHDPNYPAYSAALAFLGLKAAYEKAKIAKLQTVHPDGRQQGREGGDGEGLRGRARRRRSHRGVRGPAVRLPQRPGDAWRLGKGHQAVMGTAYGTTKLVNGKVTVTNIKHYPAERVQPPEGMAAPTGSRAG